MSENGVTSVALLLDFVLLHILQNNPHTPKQSGRLSHQKRSMALETNKRDRNRRRQTLVQISRSLFAARSGDRNDRGRRRIIYGGRRRMAEERDRVAQREKESV
ncbi:unnamed protein product [Camellia sinensis]